MSTRVSYTLAICLLLLAAVLRFAQLGTLPPGLSTSEVNDIRIAETVRQGRVEVFYDLHGEGREGLYQTLVAAVTSAGSGLIGYRILSVCIGLITLALVYTLGTRLFGTLAGLAAMALLSVGMFPIVLSRIIAPETMLPLFVTAVLLSLVLSLPIYGASPSEEPRTTPFAALGILLGLSFYVHPISFVLALFALLFIAYVVITRRPLTRRALSVTWFAVVVMVVIATPYAISSLQHPDLAASGRLLIDDPGTNFFRWLTVGFSGLFFAGDANPVVNLPGRPLIDLVSGLIMIVGLVGALRCWRQARCALLLIALVFFTPLALLAPDSPNFLAFAPLLPLIALLFGLGVTTLYHSLPLDTRRFAALGLTALLIFNVAWTVYDLFGKWATLPEMQQAYNARLGQLAHYIDLTAGTTPTVICTSDLTPQNNPIVLTSTQILALMMHRQDAILRYADCGTALILTDGGAQEQIILTDRSGTGGVNPYVRDWLMRGEVLNRPDVPPDAVITLGVADALANHIGSFTTISPVTFAQDGAKITFPPIRFGGNIAFLGYEPDWAATYAGGDVIPVVTYWRVDGFVPPDLRLFTHILGDSTSIAAQSDAISVLPAQLRPRDIFIQVTYVQLPRTMPHGTYSISIGAYEDNTDIRLPIFVDDQPLSDPRLFLGQIDVQGR